MIYANYYNLCVSNLSYAHCFMKLCFPFFTQSKPLFWMIQNTINAVAVKLIVRSFHCPRHFLTTVPQQLCLKAFDLAFCRLVVAYKAICFENCYLYKGSKHYSLKSILISSFLPLLDISRYIMLSRVHISISN